MNPFQFWWKAITAVQFKVWRSAIREAWRSAARPASTKAAILGRLPQGGMITAGLSAAHAQPLAPLPAASTKPVPLIRITKRPDFTAHLEILKQIAGLCREQDIELVLVASPLHRANEIRFDPAELSDAIGQISRIAPIWDFTGSSSLTDRPELWVGDISHFSPEVARMMLRRIFGDAMPVDWNKFGQLRSWRAVRSH